jgi:hypothetical protein
MENGAKPWGVDDPDLAAIRRRVDEEIERASRQPIKPDEPDPVVQDFYSDRPGPRCFETTPTPPLRPTNVVTAYGSTVFINITLYADHSDRL